MSEDISKIPGLLIGERGDGQLALLQLNGRSFGPGQIALVQLYALQQILASLKRIEQKLESLS